MHFSRKQIRESATLKMVKQAEKDVLEKQLNESKTIIPEVNDVMNESALARSNRFKNLRINAKAAIKEHFLTEAIKYIYNECMIPDLQKESTNVIRDTVIRGFIKENGVENILRTLNRKSLFLADIAKAVKESTDDVVKANEDKLTNPDTKLADVNVDPEYQDSFIDKMGQQKEEIQDVGAMVQSHVVNNVEDFIASNVEDKQQIKEILDEVKEKVANIKAANADVAEDIKESMIINAKRKIHDLKSSKKNLLESMVKHLAKRVINENHTAYLTESKTIDTDKIVETAECMLTMLVLSEALGFELNEQEVHAMYK